MKISHIMDIVTSRLAKDLTLVFAGNIFAAFLGFLAVLIIARKLTVSEFGLFILVTSFMRIVSSLSDLGTNPAMIKFASSYLGEEKTPEAAQVLRTTFLITTIFRFILSLIIFNTAELLSTEVFHNSSLAPLLKLAAFGVFAVATLNFLKAALCAYQLFRMSVIVQNSVDLGKLFVVLVLVFYSKINVFTAIAVFAITPLIGLLLGSGFLWQRLFSKGKQIKNIINRLFSYSKWTFANNACRLTLSYVGIFMLAKMLSIEAAGIYGLALNLTLIFPIINTSLGSVLLPKVSRFREMAQFESYIKGSLKTLFVLVILLIPFLFLSHKIILLFFGLRYVDSVPVFNLLLLGFITSTVSITMRVALLSMNKPHVMSMVNALKLIVMVIGCYILIPISGVLAPAILTLIISISGLVFLSTYIFRHMKKGELSFQNDL